MLTKYLFKSNFLTLIENAQLFYKKLIHLEACSVIQLYDDCFVNLLIAMVFLFSNFKSNFKSSVKKHLLERLTYEIDNQH